MSPEYFDDFSIILYNKYMDIKQIENILRVKFNTTNYKSRLEYQIALIEKEDNIDPLKIHKKFYENNLIYKNIIYSSGKESIETNISLIKNGSDFQYDKNYTLITYGKDYYGNKINYFYMEPITLFISDPYESNEDKETNTNTNTPKTTNNNDNNKIETENTYAIKESTTKSEIESSKKNIESTIIATKITIESKDKDLAESSTNSESKNTFSIDKEKTDTIIIEQSNIPINSIVETENSEESIPVIVINDKRNDKTLTLSIIFSVIGGIIILGAIIGYTIYYIKINANKINESNTEINILKKN